MRDPTSPTSPAFESIVRCMLVMSICNIRCLKRMFKGICSVKHSIPGTEHGRNRVRRQINGSLWLLSYPNKQPTSLPAEHINHIPKQTPEYRILNNGLLGVSRFVTTAICLFDSESGIKLQNFFRTLLQCINMCSQCLNMSKVSFVIGGILLSLSIQAENFWFKHSNV